MIARPNGRRRGNPARQPLLTLGFYVLAFSIAWGLFALAVFYVTHSPVINLQLVIGCVVAGALILISIARQSVPFNPPGPRLDLRTQPRLAASLQELARAGKDRLPQEIYLDLNANASVFERGGLLGLGTTRVMILGLPLM